ncbi:MAG: glucokinase [Prochloraceae cyanobacterium]
MKILAGDIGGTKTILRLVEAEENSQNYQTIEQKKYPSQEYPDLVPMVEKFLDESKESSVDKACFAIAGPVINNTSKLTNINWSLDSKRLSKELKIEKVSLINDFAAISYGILGIKKEELETIQKGEEIENTPIAVIGAGTGLGEGFLVPQGDNNYQVFASEGGHSDFAPRSQLELELLEYIKTKNNLDRVSAERVISGQGIVSIYQFLRDTNYAPESPEIGDKIKQWEEDRGSEIDPGAVISIGAKEGNDSLCQQTMEIFVAAYGAEAGNLALKILAYGGVYIAGGIAAKNVSLMKKDLFLQPFQQKGRMTSLLEKIPVHIVTNQAVGSIGSILYAMRS